MPIILLKSENINGIEIKEIIKLEIKNWFAIESLPPDFLTKIGIAVIGGTALSKKRSSAKSPLIFKKYRQKRVINGKIKFFVNINLKFSNISNLIFFWKSR